MGSPWDFVRNANADLQPAAQHASCASVSKAWQLVRAHEKKPYSCPCPLVRLKEQIQAIQRGQTQRHRAPLLRSAAAQPRWDPANTELPSPQPLGTTGDSPA